MIKFLAQLVIVIIIGYATYEIMTLALGVVPTAKQLKMNRKKAAPDLNKTFKPIFHAVGKFLYMEPSSEAAKADTLRRAGIDLTPREYLARSILGLLFGLLVCFWGFLAKINGFVLIGLLLGVALFGVSNDEANKRLKEKDAEVKKELPKFVSTIVVSLRSEKNIVKVIESYIKDAKPALRSDLEVLLSQMSTGNIEAALRNFDLRIGAQEVSSLVTSLIYIENGVDQTAALQYLESDMRQAQSTIRRLELEKLPGKMRRAFVPVGIVLIAMFFYTIFMQIFENFTLFL